MTRAAFALSFVLIASSASAQSVIRHLDLSQLGWGNIEVHEADVDGNPATIDWAIEGIDPWGGNQGQWRVVTERPDGVCVGGWFQPSENVYADVKVSRGGDHLIIKSRSIFTTELTLVKLNAPQCVR